MASDLEKVLAKYKYAALPLPRTRGGPTTIFSFTDGFLTVVRNAGSCFPDIPVTKDPAQDLAEFTKEFTFEFSGLIGFLAKVTGIGSAKGELEVQKVHHATIRLGDLSHQTIETGAVIDYLLKLDPDTRCARDIFDKRHFTVVAGLQAGSFTYNFVNKKGLTISLKAEDAQKLFGGEAGTKVEVSSEGKVSVIGPRYVGVVTWSGDRFKDEVDRAKAYTKKKGKTVLFAELGGQEGALGGGRAGFKLAGVADKALSPLDIRRQQLATFREAGKR